MNIKSILNGYFEQTPVPDELNPQNVRKFVVPNLGEKKETQTTETDEPEIITKSAPTVANADKNIGKNANEQDENETQRDILTASSLIKIVKYHKLTGKEFLELLGNSKIGNKAYQEIENNPNLTVKRLIELLEESPLTSSDYEKLIIAVQRMAQHKAEARAKIKTEPNRIEKTNKSPSYNSPEKTDSSKADSAKNDKAVADTSAEKQTITLPQKPQKGYVPGFAALSSDDDKDSDVQKKEENDNDKNDKYNESNATNNSEKSEVKISLGGFDTEDEDEDEDENEYEEDENKKSGKKKIIVAAAIGAVILIGLSFGIRYLTTGTLFPSNNTVKEQKVLSEAEIYTLLNTLPSPEPAFAADDTYSAGGIREESVIKDPFCGNKRLLYTENNRLYIYEQIGGQTALLETRDYEENTVLGVIGVGDKLAAVSTGVSEPYSFSYTQTLESEDGENSTVVTNVISRKETYLEITDASSPEKSTSANKIALSGTLVDAYLQNGRIIAVTYEEMKKESAGEDKATFMPYISISGEKSFCLPENVFISSPSHKSFVTVFSLDPNNLASFDIATLAGGTKQLVAKSENELFIAQGNILVRYELSEGINQNGSCKVSGNTDKFSRIGANGGEIRITTENEGGAVLTVLDENLEVLGEIKNIGVGENIVGTCFFGKETYIVTENGVCYGIDGENNVMSKSSAKITDETIYKFNDNIGINVSATDDGSKRTGLIVSTVKLDGNLTPIYNLEISSKTTAANALDEYISSPAENDIGTIGSNADNGALVIPVKYFDGISEVEMFVICTVNSDGTISVNGKITEYDRRSDYIFARVDGDTVIAVTKGKIITAARQDGNIMGYFSAE